MMMKLDYIFMYDQPLCFLDTHTSTLNVWLFTAMPKQNTYIKIKADLSLIIFHFRAGLPAWPGRQWLSGS